MKKSFILYTDIYDSIKTLPDLEKGRLLTAIFEYVISGREINTKNTTGMAFSFIKKTLDRDTKKWNALVSRNRRNILSRWQKSKLRADTKNTSGKTGIPNPLDSVSVSDSDSDNNIDISSKAPETSVRANSPHTRTVEESLAMLTDDQKWQLAEGISRKHTQAIQQRKESTWKK